MATGLAIPLYAYPTDHSWAAVIAAAKASPSVRVVAIVDPSSSGAGTSADPNFVSGIKALRAAGISVLGYISTRWAARPSSEVRGEALDWWTWYRPDGVFFDEMATGLGGENYYSALSAYAKSLGMTVTWGNPGTLTLPTYLGTVDALFIYEQAGYPTLADLITGGSPLVSPSNFGYIAYSVAFNGPFIRSTLPYVAWLYATDDGGANPYDTAPTYLPQLMALLASQASPDPAPMSPTISISTVDQSGAAMPGFFIDSVIDVTSGTALSPSASFTPATVSATAGHSLKVAVDDYGASFVIACNVGAFTRDNTPGSGKGTSVFAVQGSTSLVFTMGPAPPAPPPPPPPPPAVTATITATGSGTWRLSG